VLVHILDYVRLPPRTILVYKVHREGKKMVTCFRLLSILYETGHVTGTFFSFENSWVFYFKFLICKSFIKNKRKTKIDEELSSATRKS